MAIAFVASSAAGGHGLTGPISSSPDVDTTGGNLLVGAMSVFQGNTTEVYSDNKTSPTNTWADLALQTGSNGKCRISYAKAPGNVGSGHHGLVTATPAIAALAVAFAAFSGVAANPIDQSHGAVVSGGTGSAGAVTPTVDGELVIVVLALENTDSPTFPSGFTSLVSIPADTNPPTNNYGLHVGFKVLGAGTAGFAIDPAWVWTNSVGGSAAVIATFKPAGGNVTLAPSTGNVAAAGGQSTISNGNQVTPFPGNVTAAGGQSTLSGMTRHMIASGDYQTAANWDFGVLPTFATDFTIVNPGVDATLNGNLTQGDDSATTQKRFQVAAGGSFTRQSGIFTVRCPLVIDGTITLGGTGSALVFDSATGKTWPVGPSVNGTTANFLTRGTLPSSRVTLGVSGSGNAFFGNGNGSYQMGIDRQNDTWVGVLGSGGYAAFHSPVGTSQHSRGINSSSIACGTTGAFAVNPASDFDYRIFDEQYPQIAQSSTSGFSCQSSVAATTGIRRLEQCGLKDSHALWYDTSMKGWSVRNVFLGGAHFYLLRDNQLPTHFELIGHYETALPMIVGMPGFTAQWGFTWMDGQAISASLVSSTANATDSGITKYDGWVIGTNDGFSAADGMTPANRVTSGAGMVTEVSRIINASNPKGKASSGLTVGHDIPFERRSVRHCSQALTDEGPGTVNAAVGAVNYGQTHGMERVQGSLLYRRGAIGTASHGIAHQSNTDIPTGFQATYGGRFIATTGSAGATVNCTGKTWETDTTHWFAAIGATLIVVDTHSVVGAPAQGTEIAIASNTGTSITTSSAWAGTLVGVEFFIKVLDQIDPDGITDNAYFGCTAGQNWDSTGQPTTPILAVGGLCLSKATNTNCLDMGAGTDPIAHGPQLLLDEPHYVNINTADQDFLIDPLTGLKYALAPAHALATLYHQGDIVSTTDAGFYTGLGINWRAKVTHTSDATTQPGHNAGSSTYYNQWEMASIYRLQLATLAGETYSDPSILLYGDTPGVAAIGCTPIQMYLSRARHAMRPTAPTLLALLTADPTDPWLGTNPGAVNGNVPLPIVSSATSLGWMMTRRRRCA